MKSPDDKLVEKLMNAIDGNDKIAPIERWHNLIKRGAINKEGEVLLKSPITEKPKPKRFQVTIKVLDAFCCEGIATLGIINAFTNSGYNVHITGVDIVSKFARRYRGDTFVTADAVDYIGNYGHNFDFCWASPPCQRYTRGNSMNDTSDYPDLISVTRGALQAINKPYVIENVADARSIMHNPIMLCGTMFGLSAIDTDGSPLEMIRHRLFETNYKAEPNGQCNHRWFSTQVAGVYGGARNHKVAARTIRRGGYVPKDRRVKEKLLGVPHGLYTLHGLNQSVPPVYSEHMVKQFLNNG